MYWKEVKVAIAVSHLLHITFHLYGLSKYCRGESYVILSHRCEKKEFLQSVERIDQNQ